MDVFLYFVIDSLRRSGRPFLIDADASVQKFWDADKAAYLRNRHPLLARPDYLFDAYVWLCNLWKSPAHYQFDALVLNLPTV